MIKRVETPSVKRPGNAADEIFEVLRSRILDGIYPAGLKLSQAELADQLSVSRTPLREALSRLQAHGLVTATNNKGVEVAALQLDEAEQSYALRLLIEPSIISGLIDDFTPADFNRMKRALNEMHLYSGRAKDYQDAHLAFHEVALTRYPKVMQDMIKGIYWKITRHQRAYFLKPNTSGDFADLDDLFLDALVQKNAELARQYLEMHLIDAGLGLLADIDPDYVPKTLLLTAKGLGIHIECDAYGKPARPAQILWNGRQPVKMPVLSTTNLEHKGE
ncbi:GntR family transcriptional regulator [Advenella sp. WQ 585]|uniref:GntR family transcriptional regulator n=1 Tax=Advenella mandrilli TaxID=2800330 RepID=A0ABS1E9F7_9BURK|nr:GntR family transcriptional regulator [Advenella mandrilli]MBK1780391.1 GntR family transcriptional regulator [Advenella mandrilli]